jgi:hypothetical protein
VTVAETATRGDSPRRPGPVVTVGVLVVLTLGLVLGDVVVRGMLERETGDRVRAALSLDRSHPVAVDVEGASVLWQLAIGQFERVRVDAGEVGAGRLRGHLTATATGIPTDLSQPARRVEVEYRVSENALSAIAEDLSEAAIDDVTLDAGEIRFRSEATLLGLRFEFGVGLEPEVSGGALTFRPTTLLLNGGEIDAQRLADQFGTVGRALLSSRSVCIAEHLPRDLSLESVTVADDSLVLALTSDNLVLSGGGVNERGSC